MNRKKLITDLTQGILLITMKSIRYHALNIGKNVIRHEGQITGLLF